MITGVGPGRGVGSDITCTAVMISVVLVRVTIVVAITVSCRVALVLVGIGCDGVATAGTRTCVDAVKSCVLLLAMPHPVKKLTSISMPKCIVFIFYCPL